jgi:hypothetical protein
VSVRHEVHPSASGQRRQPDLARDVWRDRETAAPSAVLTAMEGVSPQGGRMVRSCHMHARGNTGVMRRHGTDAWP